MRKTIEGETAEGHIGHHRAGGTQRAVPDAKKAGIAWVGPRRMARLPLKGNKWRDSFIQRTFETGQNGTHAGCLVLACLECRVAAHTNVGVVLIACARHRPDDGEFVHHFRKQWHVLTDFDAGDICFDGLELATDVGWGIRFHVKHVLMTWSTGQEDHDDGFVVAFDTGTRFGRQELRQGETAERETPDGHKITSTQAITEAALIISPDCQHGNIALPRPGFTGHTIMWLRSEYSR